MVNLFALFDGEHTRWLGYTRSVLALVFIIILGVLAARIFWLIAEPDGSLIAVSSDYTQGQGHAGRTESNADISVLFRENPFAERAISVSDIPDAPQTTLNLELIGMRAATVDSEGAAIIVTPDHKQHLFSPGDKILDDVYLDRVLTDRVILKKNGVLESLFRDNRQGRFLVIGGEEPRQVTVQQNTGQERQVVDRQAFIESVGFTPVTEGSTLIGYRLASRGNTGPMMQAGLVDGDIVTVVNGLHVANVEAEAFYTMIAQADQLNIELKRSGVTVPVTVQFGSGSEYE